MKAQYTNGQYGRTRSVTKYVGIGHYGSIANCAKNIAQISVFFKQKFGQFV